MHGILSIVATPIGNLGDITFRAIETLKNADVILCEDTRVTGKLLAHFDIKTPTMSYHQHSDGGRVREIEALLQDEKNLALVTDAGTPGISDPGNVLVGRIVQSAEHGAIVPVPGPSAVIAALSVSGFPTEKFLFLGFPPQKNKRRKFFSEVGTAEHTTVFYESNHRIKKCLVELSAFLAPDRQVCICRELTKVFESIYRGTIADVCGMNIPEKGEFVIVIGGN